jgi:hypothetical protein
MDDGGKGMTDKQDEELIKEYFNDVQLDEIVKTYVQPAKDEEDRKLKMMILSLVCDIRNSRGDHEKSLEEIESLRSQLGEWQSVAASEHEVAVQAVEKLQQEKLSRAIAEAERDEALAQAEANAVFERKRVEEFKVEFERRKQAEQERDEWLDKNTILIRRNNRLDEANTDMREVLEGYAIVGLDGAKNVLSRYPKEGDTTCETDTAKI